jgi:hypothetical protein
MGVNRSKTDQFQLRLPPGLRDRIKTYAEAHGRSMNEEIVRLLEREFPETWPLATQITQLITLSNVLRTEVGTEDLNILGDALFKTVEGVASGRVRGVDDETREAVAAWLREWNAELDDVNRDNPKNDFDEEETRNWERAGTTAKFVDPAEVNAGRLIEARRQHADYKDTTARIRAKSTEERDSEK